jgi:hypothetical protein
MIQLDPPVQMSVNENFYIYLYLSDGGHPYDRTSVVPVLLGSDLRTLVESSASPGESFCMTDKGWDDFYDYDDPSGYQNTGNFCIKAHSIYNPVGINESDIDKKSFIIRQNAPNPFSSNTVFNYVLEHHSEVQLLVYDQSGRLIANIINEHQDAGEHSIRWEASGLGNGVYIYTLIVGNESESGRMVLIK